MKPKSIFAIVFSTLLLALASCEDPSVKDMQDRINELEDRLAAMESSGGAQNNPSDSNPSGTTPSGNPSSTTVSGSVGGHDYVDLGLPSGTLWATCNVGADSPEEYGDYFAWGETTPKSDYSWSTYKYGTAEDQLTKYCNKGSSGKNGFTDNKTVLDAEDDAATANWGNGWRMPTREELAELYDGCEFIFCTYPASNGLGITGALLIGPNRNTLFLPAAGCRDGSSLYSAGYRGHFWSNYGSGRFVGYYGIQALNEFSDSKDRYIGLSVRPVVNR